MSTSGYYFPPAAPVQSSLDGPITLPTVRNVNGVVTDLILSAQEKASRLFLWDGLAGTNLSLRGIVWAGVQDGQQLRLVNVSADPLKDFTINPNLGGAGNQYVGQGDIKLDAGNGCTLIYVTGTWRSLGWI